MFPKKTAVSLQPDQRLNQCHHAVAKTKSFVSREMNVCSVKTLTVGMMKTLATGDRPCRANVGMMKLSAWPLEDVCLKMAAKVKKECRKSTQNVTVMNTSVFSKADVSRFQEAARVKRPARLPKLQTAGRMSISACREMAVYPNQGRVEVLMIPRTANVTWGRSTVGSPRVVSPWVRPVGRRWEGEPPVMHVRRTSISVYSLADACLNMGDVMDTQTQHQPPPHPQGQGPVEKVR